MVKNNGSARVKGFTLVEMIVVMAIIAILAGTLNLATQGFIRNARLETANDKARLLFTGFQNVLTQCEIKQDDSTIRSGSTATGDLTNVVISFKVYNGEVQCYDNGLTGGSGTLNTDYTGSIITKYSDQTAGSKKSNIPQAIAGIIDNTFDGEAKVYIDYENYEVKSVVYKPMTDTNKTTSVSDFSDGDLDTFGTGNWYLGFANSGTQDTAYAHHPLYGVYPYQDTYTT